MSLQNQTAALSALCSSRFADAEQPRDAAVSQAALRLNESRIELAKLIAKLPEMRKQLALGEIEHKPLLEVHMRIRRAETKTEDLAAGLATLRAAPQDSALRDLRYQVERIGALGGDLTARMRDIRKMDAEESGLPLGTTQHVLHANAAVKALDELLVGTELSWRSAFGDSDEGIPGQLRRVGTEVDDIRGYIAGLH